MVKLMRYFKHYIAPMIVIIILVIGQSLLDLLLPDIMAKVTTLIKQPGALNEMIIYGLIALGIAIVIMGIALVVSLIASKVAMGIGAKIRSDMFRQIEKYSLAEMDKFSTASLITRTTLDVTQVTNMLIMSFRVVIAGPIMLIGAILMSLKYSVPLTLVIASTAPIILILVLVIGKMIMPLFTSMQKKLDNLTLVAREGITGVRVIRAFNNDDVQLDKFHKANSDLANNQLKVDRISAVLMPAVTLIFSLGTIALWWVGAFNATSIEYVAGISAVVQYGMRIMMAFMMFAMVFIMFPRASACAKRINEVLLTSPSVVDSDTAISLDRLDCDKVVFDNVTFSFGDSAEACLKNISFVAEKGKTTAIIGGTGSGKSTIINLLMRFYDIKSGKITIGNHSISDVTMSSLRDCIGYVPQKAMMFNRSIKENILMGCPKASDAEIIACAEASDSSEFIAKKELGYDTTVAKGGSNLSGGQKQRLSIARAIIDKPPIYIFDDCFSALDVATDRKVRENLKAFTSDSINFTIAQRISTIQGADNIIVLKDGEIVGQGNHEYLLKNCSEYLEIYNSQVKEEVK